MNAGRPEVDNDPENLKAIGEALTRTYQNIIDEKIPQAFLDLLEKLSNGDIVSDSADELGLAQKNEKGAS